MTIPSSSSGWSGDQINGKIRSITGTPSTDQLTDVQISAYRDNYYIYTMPFELKVQIQDNFLDFKTTPGTDVYSFPGTFVTDQPGAYADGFPLIFYQDPDIFYQDWPQQYAVDNVATGDGSTLTFTGTLQNPPLIIGTLFITDGVSVFQDNGSGSFTLTYPTNNTVLSTGSIDYTTGIFSVTFITVPASSAVIYAKYQGYSGNRPQGVLFFENQFTLRPVPDQVYQIRMQGFVNPTPFTGSATATQVEWGPLIAYGAALEIFSDRGDMENYNRYYPQFQRYEKVALSRTIQQYDAQQSVPRF